MICGFSLLRVKMLATAIHLFYVNVFIFVVFEKIAVYFLYFYLSRICNW